MPQEPCSCLARMSDGGAVTRQETTVTAGSHTHNGRGLAPLSLTILRTFVDTRSPWTVATYHYWSSTMFPDHHLPLLAVVTPRRAKEEKPLRDAMSRTAEYHLLELATIPIGGGELQPSCRCLRPT